MLVSCGVVELTACMLLWWGQLVLHFAIRKHPLADEDIDQRVAFAVLVGGERDLDVGLGGEGVDNDAGGRVFRIEILPRLCSW